ncbi:replication-relaxation family protein [Lysinibacillus sp. CNPSo 3705]|uniref:replication-relaxation family protein n=1 Tax=Lysinibacillus sp. CNPSo 3705 TaxID=3028148 RepID=UPI00236478B4|nr:replication-relaxation family protein [Lysinibacillus sp. CNPSo 3705]MDD1505215.1 replication-relaxation family protein [Lysinibacillus sp. CNPSo 3705]
MREKAVFSLPKNTKYSSALLYLHDFVLLQQLAIHRFMRARDVIKLLECTREIEGVPAPTKNAISKRLRRLVAAGVLVLEQDEEMNLQGMRFNSFFYRLGLRGFRALKEFTNDDSINPEAAYSATQKLSIPKLHNQAASTLVNEIYMHLLQMQHDSKVSDIPLVLRGGMHDAFKDNRKESYRVPVQPDYVIDYKNILIAIEMDTGNQRGTANAEKVKQYKNWLNNHPLATYKKLLIVFAVMDESVAPVIIKDRTRRVVTLRERTGIQHVEWMNDTRIGVYCALSIFSKELIGNWIQGISLSSRSERSFFVSQWFGYLAGCVKSGSMFLETVSKDEYKPFSQKWDEQWEADEYMYLKENEKRPKHFFVLYVDTGSSVDYRRITANIKRVKTINESDLTNLTVNLLLVYSSEVERIFDSIGNLKQLDIPVYSTSSELFNEMYQRGEQVERIQDLPLHLLSRHV